MFMLSSSSSLSRSHWMESSSALLSLMLSSDLLLNPQVYIINKDTGPSTEPWETSLITDLYWDIEWLTAMLWMLPFSQFLIHLTSIHQTHISPIYRQGCCVGLCQKFKRGQGRWMILLLWKQEVFLWIVFSLHWFIIMYLFQLFSQFIELPM